MKKNLFVQIASLALILVAMSGCKTKVDDSNSIASTSSSSSVVESTPSTPSSTVTETDTVDPAPVEHVHAYNEQNICDCGQTKPGAYAIDVDANANDWNNTVKSNALKKFGEDGRGFEAMAFIDEQYLFVYGEVVSNSEHVYVFETVYNGSHSFNISRDIESKTFTFKSETATCLTYYVIQEEVDSKWVSKYEMILELSSVIDADENLKCAFDVNVPGEESALSYSSEQIEYWVLYGLNAWHEPNQMLVEADGIHHTHIYDAQYHCIICGAEKEQNYAITVDGLKNDWPEEVLNHTLSTTDGEERTFSVAAYCDTQYVYVFGSISHFSKHISTFEILSFVNGTWVELYTINNGDIYYANNADIFEYEMVYEYADEETLLNVTNVEIVLKRGALEQTDQSVKLGFSANMGDESSSVLGFSDTQATWWVLGGINSWSNGEHFVIAETGISHNHIYDDESECKLCGEAKPVSYAITTDGSLEEWPSVVVENKIKTYGSDNRGFEVVAFKDEQFAYLYTKVITNGNTVLGIEVVANSATVYPMFKIDQTPAGCLSKHFVTTFDENLNLYVTIMEVVVENAILADEQGNIKLAVDIAVDGSEAQSAASYSDTQPGYWNIGHTNAWNPADHKEVSENGILHDHVYDSNNQCVFCGEENQNAQPTYAITVDGDLSDWTSGVLANALVTSNDVATLKYVGFTQDNYVYIGAVTTYTGSFFQLEIIRTWSEALGGNNNWIRVKADGAVYYADGTTNYTSGIKAIIVRTTQTSIDDQVVTTYEIVLEKEEGVKYGFSSNLDGDSLVLAFGNAWAPSYTISSSGIVQE